MRCRPFVILSAALLLSAPLLAGQDPPKPSGDERRAASTESMGQTQSVEGTVKQFDPGKKLVLTTADSRTKTFNLDQKGLILDIDPSVAVGSQVKVTLKKGDDGTSRLTVEPTSKSS